MLLAGLQRHAQGGAAVNIDGHADEPPRHLAHELLAGREERGMGAAIAKRRAKALRASQRHVRAKLSRGQKQRQAEQIRGHRHARAGCVRAFAEGAVVDHAAVGGGVLHQRAEHATVKGEALVVAHHHLDATRLGAGRDHRHGLRVAQLRDEEQVGIIALGQTGKHVHGLSRCGGLVQQRRAGNFHGG